MLLWGNDSSVDKFGNRICYTRILPAEIRWVRAIGSITPMSGPLMGGNGFSGY